MDINWRPVFWDDESSAMAAIKPYVGKADIVKMSDEEAEWLFGIPARDALQHPLKACAAPCPLSCPAACVSCSAFRCCYLIPAFVPLILTVSVRYRDSRRGYHVYFARLPNG